MSTDNCRSKNRFVQYVVIKNILEFECQEILDFRFLDEETSLEFLLQLHSALPQEVDVHKLN
jgi:hypothetical protein